MGFFVVKTTLNQRFHRKSACERIVNREYLYRNRMVRIAVLELIAVGYAYSTIPFRFSQGAGLRLFQHE